MDNLNNTGNFFEMNQTMHLNLNVNEFDRLKISLMLEEEDEELVSLFHVLVKVGEWLDSKDIWIEDKYGQKVESAMIRYKPMTLLKRLVNLDESSDERDIVVNPNS